MVNEMLTAQDWRGSAPPRGDSFAATGLCGHAKISNGFKEGRAKLNMRDWLNSLLSVMTSDTEILTSEEFASLLTVGNTPENNPAPQIPAAHSARLIAPGYLMDLAGRLRMTTPGRVRIRSGQLAN
jgi:hypothetical protein